MMRRAFEYELRSKPKTEAINFCVIKIGNIPWEVSSRDVCNMIQPYLLHWEANQDWVHTPIDRCTGKTLSDLFVEIPSMFEALLICEKLDRTILKQRALSVVLSTYEEVLSVHLGPEAIRQGRCLTRTDVSQILDICRNYKVWGFGCMDY